MTLPIIWEDHLHEITRVFADLARILTDNATVSTSPITPGRRQLKTFLLDISSIIAFQSSTYTILHYTLIQRCTPYSLSQRHPSCYPSHPL